MSSVSRSFAVAKEGLTKFMRVESVSYEDSNDETTHLFPFVCSNGVLDITYEGSSFQEQMVDISGVSPNDDTNSLCRIIGAPRLATSLGDNFKAYIRSWRAEFIDSGSPIEVVIPAQVVRVQEGNRNNISGNSGEAYTVSTSKPASDNYITGESANAYRTTYIFKTPLTFSVVEDGVTQYFTFKTITEQED